MEQEKTTMKEVANNLLVSSLFTLWTIGASVTATAVLLSDNKEQFGNFIFQTVLLSILYLYYYLINSLSQRIHN